MKKLLSIALCLCILTGLVCTLPTTASAATETQEVYSLDFEDKDLNDHLTFVEEMPTIDKAPIYPENDKWGIVSNNGYITYTDVTNPKSKVANTYAETVYKPNGTAVTQTPHMGRKVGGWTYETYLTVSDKKAHSGTKSFEVISADMAYATGINIEKAGTYTLTYWVSNFDDIKNKDASYGFGSGVFSTINIGRNRTTDTYYTDTSLAVNSEVEGQMPNHLNTSADAMKCPLYQFSIFRSRAALKDVTLEDGQEWYQVTHTFTTTENHKKVYFAISNNCGKTVYIDDIMVTTEVEVADPIPEPAPTLEGLTTAYNNAAALKTGANSSTNENGMRLYNEITKEAIAGKNIVEFGAIVTVEEFLENELTFESEKYAYGVAWTADGTTNKLWDETETTYVFTAYLLKIPTTRYDDNYVIRAYAKDNEGNYYYGDAKKLCVFDIAYAIDCGDNLSGTAQSAEDVAAFEAFANFDGNYATYDAWLAANDKEAGSLR